MSILVKAIREGYYGRRRRPDRPEEAYFRIPDESLLGSWMEVISEDDLSVDEEVVIDAKPPKPTEPQDAPEPENTAEQEGEDAIRADTLDQQIIQVLSGLDHEDDSLWTGNGLVRMEVIEKALGDDSIKRADVKNAWPGFERHSQ